MAQAEAEAEERPGRMEGVVVFVKNLDKNVDESLLRERFSVFGTVASCEIPQGKKGSKGHGFITFETEEAAMASIQGMNGSDLCGKLICVDHFINKENRDVVHDPPRPVCHLKSSSLRTVYIKNLSPTIDALFLKITCSPYGDICNVKIIRDANGVSKGFAFVTFRQIEQATKAIEAMNGRELDGRVLFAGPAIKKAARRRQQVLQQQQQCQRQQQQSFDHEQLLYEQHPSDWHQHPQLDMKDLPKGRLGTTSPQRCDIVRQPHATTHPRDSTASPNRRGFHQTLKSEDKAINATINSPRMSPRKTPSNNIQIPSPKCCRNSNEDVLNFMEFTQCRHSAPYSCVSRKLDQQHSNPDIHLPKLNINKKFHSPQQCRGCQNHQRQASFHPAYLNPNEPACGSSFQQRQEYESFLFQQSLKTYRTRSLSPQCSNVNQKLKQPSAISLRQRSVCHANVEHEQKSQEVAPDEETTKDPQKVQRESQSENHQCFMSCAKEEEGEKKPDLGFGTLTSNHPYQGINLYVKHLDDSVDDVMLKDMFSKFGEVVSAKVMMEGERSRGFGFVCFAKAEDAARATRDMRRNAEDGEKKPLYVAPAQRKEERQAFFREKLKIKQTKVAESQDIACSENIMTLLEQSRNRDEDCQRQTGTRILDLSLSTLQTGFGPQCHVQKQLFPIQNSEGLPGESCQCNAPNVSKTKILNVSRCFPRRQNRSQLNLECFNPEKLRTPLIKPTMLENLEQRVKNNVTRGAFRREAPNNALKGKQSSKTNYISASPLPSLFSFSNPQSLNRDTTGSLNSASCISEMRQQHEVCRTKLPGLGSLNLTEQGKMVRLAPIGHKPTQLASPAKLPDISTIKTMERKQEPDWHRGLHLGSLSPSKQASAATSKRPFGRTRAKLKPHVIERSASARRFTPLESLLKQSGTSCGIERLNLPSFVPKPIPPICLSALGEHQAAMIQADCVKSGEDETKGLMLPSGIISSDEECSDSDVLNGTNLLTIPQSQPPLAEMLKSPTDNKKTNIDLPQIVTDEEFKDIPNIKSQDMFSVQPVISVSDVRLCPLEKIDLTQVCVTSSNQNQSTSQVDCVLHLQNTGFAQEADLLQDSGFQDISEAGTYCSKRHSEAEQYTCEDLECFNNTEYEETIHTTKGDHGTVLQEDPSPHFFEASTWCEQNISNPGLPCLPPFQISPNSHETNEAKSFDPPS